MLDWLLSLPASRREHMLCISVAVAEALSATEHASQFFAVSHPSSRIVFQQNDGSCCFFAKIVGSILKRTEKQNQSRIKIWTTEIFFHMIDFATKYSMQTIIRK